jgi:tetratricopeptide (TPR) repeat protein
MAQVLRTIGLIAAFVSATSLGASPRLTPGQYDGSVGKLDLAIDGGRVAGYFVADGGCQFEPGRRILEGRAEGGVIVGTLTVCQKGVECPERVYPVLLFYSPEDGALTGDIRVDSGCSSPALEGHRVKLSVALDDRGNPQKAGDSARKVTKRSRELAALAFTRASRNLEQGAFERAIKEYETGLSYHDDNWAAYLGLGHAQFQRGNTYQALEAFERSRELQPEYADIYYNLACVHSRLGDKARALTNLRKSVEKGFALPEAMNADEDLHQLLADDPEFKVLVRQAWEQKSRQANRR